MPNKPSWLLRVNEILEALGGEEMAAHPFLTRAAVESSSASSAARQLN